MPTPEQSLYEALAANNTINGIVGVNIKGGLLPRNGPIPALMYTRISTVRTVGSGSRTHNAGYTGFCWARFQIDCFSADYNEVVRLAGAVGLVIARLDLTGGGVYKGANEVLNERDAGNDPNMAAPFHRSLDVKIWFQEEGRDG